MREVETRVGLEEACSSARSPSSLLEAYNAFSSPPKDGLSFGVGPLQRSPAWYIPCGYTSKSSTTVLLFLQTVLEDFSAEQAKLRWIGQRLRKERSRIEKTFHVDTAFIGNSLNVQHRPGRIDV